MKQRNIFSKLAIAILLGGCLASCGDDDPQPQPEPQPNERIQVITGDATDITENSATLSGTVSTKEGKADMVGLLLGNSDNLTIANNSKDIRISEGEAFFTKTISGLTPSTTYYFRAYSLFEDRYYYGDVKSFTTEKEKEALAKISLVSRDGMSLKVKFEPSSEVSYYYCGKGSSISQTTKYTEAKTFTYSDLKPGQEYTFTVIAYTKDGQKSNPISAKFSTASSPYSNYLCFNGDFYQFTRVETDVKYDYTAVNNTGTNWRYLYLYISNYEYVQFRYGVHQWETVSSTWGTGTYNIDNSSDYYSYNGYYYDGSRAQWFFEGKMTIQKQNGLAIIDFECEGYKKYIGHVVAQ